MEEEIILNKIREDAQKEAEAVIQEAEEKAKKIESQNKEKATKQAQEKFETMKAKITTEAMAEREKMEFEARSNILMEKKRIIEIVKEKVKQKIKDLNEAEYSKIIEEKIKLYQDEKDVEIRLPKKCYESIRKIATNYGMKVLEETDELEAGVIIRCGKIEYNYDFEENMEYRNEEIEKEIDTILFKF